MDKIPPPTGDDGRKARSDGAQSRERLLLSAMRLFAEQGFAKTSTREIALAAGTNIASISYYFGDKAGLYRAAYDYQNCPNQVEDIARLSDTGLTLREALHGFYHSMLGPLKEGDIARLSTRLLFREMLEPTGLWEAEINNGIRPAHAALTQMLSRHMGVSEADADDDADNISRLAFSIVGQAVQLMVMRDVVEQITPQLMDQPSAIDIWIDRMVDYAEAMVDVEQRRTSPQTTPLSRKTPA